MFDPPGKFPGGGGLSDPPDPTVPAPLHLQYDLQIALWPQLAHCTCTLVAVRVYTLVCSDGRIRVVTWRADAFACID